MDTKKNSDIGKLPESMKNKSVASHTLKLFTAEVQFDFMPITQKQFKDYLENGVPETVMEELEDHTDYCAPVFSDTTSLALDGSDVTSFIESFSPVYESALSKALADYAVPDISSYALLSEKYIKRSWYTLEINEEFDIKKLSSEVQLELSLEGEEPRATFQLFYDGVAFEFSKNYGFDSDVNYLLEEDGTLHDFEVIPFDDETAEDD